MPDRTSFPFRVIESERSRAMTTDIAGDMRRITLAFMGDRLPGESVKAWLRRGWVSAGRPPWWRWRAAFYNEAGCWSAAAVAEFQETYRKLIAAQQRRADHERTKADLIAGRRTPATIEVAVDEYRTLVARIEALEAALAVRG